MNNVILSEASVGTQGWLEDLDFEVPGLNENQEAGQSSERLHISIALGVRKYPQGNEVRFRALLSASLLQVMERGAEALGEPLLPPDASQEGYPLDELRCRERCGHEWSEPISDLHQPLWKALVEGRSRRFGIEYVLAVKINTRWGVAPSSNATPRQLLTAFGFDPAQYTLYDLDSTIPLPPDTPLSITRGREFEAQKDGRYGDNSRLRFPVRGAQTLEQDIEMLNRAELNARLLTHGVQRYVEISGIKAPSPPWSKTEIAILIAVPANYPLGGLDAFHVEAELRHSSGSIPRQQQCAEICGRNWSLISWHYASNRTWNPLHDDLGSHVVHCRGFFMTRGVSQ